ncbi:serine/threonine-protein kinase [uncultured Serinicoccus sp.]|uniref:protein kinase domain-containing protein n=1 Tax=uncultured Serinicoccus sp. TaxID=735514 RepID=UPI002625F434|nr:serine/threonine-protein kinase [uncultured Serinicoccus sp.]
MTTEMPRSSHPDVTRPVPSGGGSADTQQIVVPRRLGPWTLQERIGEGGMGVVWRASDERGREVAIKVLRSHIAHDDGARERLRREVHTLARVHHPRVAAVIDADVDGPAPYIVTEYVPGRPLDVVIEERGGLGREPLLRLARGLADALQAIHGVGIVHRDLKPGNVLLVGEGEQLDPVVIDFGIAQVADDVRLTSTGLVMGTPGYLSPELVDGGDITEATDWWGWAACLAFAASGHPPFGRGPMTVVLDRVVRGRVQLDGVDPELAPLLALALSPKPSWRPDAREVLEAVELYARGEDVTGALPRVPQESVDGGPDGGPDATQVQRAAGAPSWAKPPVGVPSAGVPSADATRATPQGPQTRQAPVRRPDPTRAAPSGPQTRQGDGQAAGAYAGAAGAHQAREPQQWPSDPREAQRWAQNGQPPRAGQRRAQGPGPDGSPRAAFAEPSPNQPSAYPGRGAGGAATAYPDGGAGGAVTAYPDGAERPSPLDPHQRQPDPRIGRSARRGTLAAMLVGFTAVAAAAPLLAWGLYAVWGVVARTVDRSLTGLVLRRHQSGPRPSDVPMAVMASPWHLLTATFATVLSLLLPLAIAGVVAMVMSGLLTTTELAPGVGFAHPVAVGVGSLVGGWLGWWGLGSTSLRRGSRTVVRGAVPAGVPTMVLVTLCLAGGAGLAYWSLMDGDMVSWWPLPGGASPLDYLPYGVR